MYDVLETSCVSRWQLMQIEKPPVGDFSGF
jgi:hypothetical protein